ncbi:hypothetical protein ACIQMY_04550 [Streptomyces sp. NPDC091368]
MDPQARFEAAFVVPVAQSDAAHLEGQHDLGDMGGIGDENWFCAEGE